MMVGDHVTVLWGDDSFRAEVLTLPASGKLAVRPEGADEGASLIVGVSAIVVGDIKISRGHTIEAPDMAEAAAREIGAGLRDTQWRVLDALVKAGSSGLIDHEHKARHDMGQTSAGVRRGELVKLSLVEYAGHLREVDGGKGSRARVWRVNALGRLVWQLERDRRAT